MPSRQLVYHQNWNQLGCCETTVRDGATLVPWMNGAVLAWDFTCVSRLAASNVATGLQDGPSVANQAEVRKRNHYSNLPRSCLFEPVAVENLGGIGEDSYKTLAAIAKRIALAMGEKRSFAFLKQRIDIAVQRGNAACVAEALEISNFNS